MGVFNFPKFLFLPFIPPFGILFNFGAFSIVSDHALCHTHVDYVRHGEIDGRSLVFLMLTALVFYHV